jgi:hypothetical protein
MKLGADRLIQWCGEIRVNITWQHRDIEQGSDLDAEAAEIELWPRQGSGALYTADYDFDKTQWLPTVTQWLIGERVKLRLLLGKLSLLQELLAAEPK